MGSEEKAVAFEIHTVTEILFMNLIILFGRILITVEVTNFYGF